MRQLNNIPELFNIDREPNFVINDIELHIPPTAISIHKEGLEYAWKTLRSKVSTKIASGNGTYHAQVNITFAPDSLILLHRLISQIRNNPFVAIQNNFIAQSISETHAVSTIVHYFTVFGLNITNHPSSPGAFLVELDLRYFNYKPFGRTLSFKKDYTIKVQEANTVKEYVHSIFPNYGDRIEANKPVLKQSYTLNTNLRTARNLSTSETSFDEFARNKAKTTSVTIDPRRSNAYKRYSNFLQLKYLNESFGINLVKGVEDTENFVPNDVFINEKLYNLFQGSKVKADGIKTVRTVGLHEVKINGLRDEDLIEFRRDLTHAMLLSGLNTRIVTKEFRSLNLGGKFFFRYRKTLRAGIEKGMSEEQQNEVIRKNRKKIFELFDNFEAKREKVKEDAKPVISSLTLTAPPERDLELVIDPRSSSAEATIVPSKQVAFYSPGSTVSISGESGKYFVSNIHRWSSEATSSLAYPVMTFCRGKIKYTDNGVVITNGDNEKAQKIVYINIQIEESIKTWIKSKGDAVFPAGTIVGFFDTSNYFEVNCSGQIINDLCLTLTGKALEEKHVADSKVVKQKMDAVSLDPKQRGFLNKEDVPFINQIKDLIENEGFSQYVYRSGLENVFQKALMLSFDSNLYEEDVKLITGKDTFGVNVDSFPKLEQDITSISCSLRNIISSIPILGYAYPTHQFLGSIEPNYQFNFIGHTPTGDGLPQKIKDLEAIRANTAYMAKNFPQIPDAANIVVESLITKLVGSFKYYDNDEKVIVLENNKEAVVRDIKPRFLISSTDTFTIEGSPGAVGLNFRFSESKSYDEEEVRAAKSSEIDENYLGRYAAVLQQGGIDLGSPTIEEGEFQPISYAKAKYVSKYWNTKYFGAKKYYGLSKWHLRKNYQQHLKGDIDQNAFDFCKDYLDPLQDFLNIYKNRRLMDMHNGKKLKVEVFSTLDRPISGRARKTQSNHFTGAAVDLRIRNMHVAEAAAIIELLEEKGFFNDSIGKRIGSPFYNSGKAAIPGRDKRKRLLGIGVYGSNASGLPFVQPSIWNAERQLMDGSRQNGFVHIDANFIVDAQNKNGYSWKLYDYRRRWGGKSDADQFSDYRTFWNRDIKEIKRLINDNVNQTLKEYSEKLSSEAPPVDSEDAPNVVESDEDEAPVATQEDGGKKPDIRQSTDDEGYKLRGTLPEDLLTFLKERTSLTPAEIETLYTSTSITSGGNPGEPGITTSRTDYSFEISQGGDRYRIKFFPPKGEKELSPAQEKVIKALQSYYKSEIKVDTDVSTEYGTKVGEIKTVVTGLSMVSPATVTVPTTDFDTVVSKTFSFSMSQVDAKTAQRDARIKNRLNSNKMLKSFTELASLMLTEPYLYVDTKEELIKEMEFIQEQLFNFPVLPTYYTSIEQLFTTQTSLSIASDINNFVENKTARSRSGGMAVASTAGGAVNAWRIARLIATKAHPALMVFDAAMLLFEVSGLYNSLSGRLDDAAKSQLKRVLMGLRNHAASIREKESTKNYIEYFRQYKNIIIGERVTLSYKGKKKVGDFLEGAGEADEVQPAIKNHIKPIYTELSIFKKFNEIANNLDANSRAANLIRRRLQDSQDIYKAGGKLDESLANFALADKLTTDEIKNYLTFLFTFPAVNTDGPDEEDHNHILGVDDNEDSVYYLNDEEDDPFYWPNTGRSAEIKYTGDLLSQRERSDGTFKEFIAFNKILYDVQKFPYLVTYQVNQQNGIKAYFENIKTKEKLKHQNRYKLAYLRKLLSAILAEHMAVHPEITEKSEDATLLRVLDASNVFELLEENAYPDIDLPQDPENPYNNSNLSPCFYYNDPNDVLDIMVSGAKSKESAAAEKILESSIQFQKGLREGIFTGSESRLDADGEATKIINEIVDPTEILRSTTEFMITGEADTKKAAYVAPITMGLFNNKVNTNHPGSNSPMEVTISSELIKNKNALEAQRLHVTGVTEQARKELHTTIEKNAKEFSRINSAFGSNLGFKIRDEFLTQLKDLKDDKLTRTLGDGVQQDYSAKAIMGLSEDSSENIYKLKTMKNAFPTFRLYLVEEDEIYTDRLTAFDDFFYYNSVISFNVHNSRELAASTATIQLQNISGVLDGTKKRILRDVDLDPNVKEENFKNEGNFIDSIVLRPGVTVQLRAGYESNTNNLDILISGKITDINYAQNNTICNITVQSFGNELTALRKGNGNKSSGNASAFYSTHQLLGSMMMSDELKHFGRAKVGAVFQIGEYKDFSLDLDIYKRESSFNFSLSRGFFDWVRDNAFGIGIGVGVLSFGMPLLKMSAQTKIVTKVLQWYGNTTSKTAMVARGIGSFINFTMVKPISFVNPFGVSKRAKDLIIKRANGLARLTAARTGQPRVALNTFDEALDYLISASRYGYNGVGPLTPQAFRLSLMPRGMDLVLKGRGALNTNVIAHGYLNGSVVTLFQKIAQILTVGKYQAGNKLGEEFLKQIIMKQRGFTALGLSGMAPSLLSKSWLGGKLGVDIAIRGSTSIMLPLSIGFGSVATTIMLGVADVIIDSAKYLYYSMIGSFSEDKNKLKKKKLLSPQDDNIFAPHPNQYMINIPTEAYSYLGSLANGTKDWVSALGFTSADIINNSTWGMINLTNDSELKDAKLNPFSLLDKRLDVKQYENTFIINGQTIWDILHECTLRHPGYIYGVRPYGNSLEYRVFFGVPNQRYWSKKISNNQIRKLNAIYIALKDASTRPDRKLTPNEINSIFPRELALYKNENRNPNLINDHFTIKAYEYFIRKTKDRFVPFRQFHMISSKRNLISNNIIISSHNMINAVSVNFINNRKKLKGSDKELSPKDWSPHLSKYGDRMETFRFRANRNIGMNNLKEKTVSYRNIVGPANALRYGLGELLYGTRKMYEGSLTILGDTKINPWDVIVLHDDVTNMYGPVEVCSVTHMLSFETGFITDVEVNALVTANEELSHPMIMQNLVYETRAKIFDEYNSFDSLGSSDVEKEKTVREIVESEVEKLVEEEIAKNGGFLRRNLGQGIGINFNAPSQKRKNEIITTVTDHVIKNYRSSRGANFLNDLVPEGAQIPEEVGKALEDAGLVGAGISGSYFFGEALRRRLISNSGLKLYGSTPMKMGLFFASSLILSQSGDAINSAISTSYNSGDLGKNMFRQHILSRMGQGNIIQLYPLVKDGLPLVTGGFEEVDETEKWNNMLGYIYNNANSTIKGYMKRQQEMKAYGKRVIQEYDRGELTSMKSAITVNLAKAAQATLGFDNATSLLGYIYMDED